jgi:hypothetical protein
MAARLLAACGGTAAPKAPTVGRRAGAPVVAPLPVGVGLAAGAGFATGAGLGAATDLGAGEVPPAALAAVGAPGTRDGAMRGFSPGAASGDGGNFGAAGRRGTIR